MSKLIVKSANKTVQIAFNKLELSTLISLFSLDAFFFSIRAKKKLYNDILGSATRVELRYAAAHGASEFAFVVSHQCVRPFRNASVVKRVATVQSYPLAFGAHADRTGLTNRV